MRSVIFYIARSRLHRKKVSLSVRSNSSGVVDLSHFGLEEDNNKDEPHYIIIIRQARL